MDSYFFFVTYILLQKGKTITIKANLKFSPKNPAKWRELEIAKISQP